MSSPVVAGVVGLLASQGRSNVEARERIEATATDLGRRGKDAAFGHGRVDAAAAVGARPRNTPPKVASFRPRPGASLRGNQVRIVAVVRDRETDLTRRNISLVVDGRRVGFRYNAANDRLVQVIRVRPGNHRVRIVVRDGWGLSDSRLWRFSTARR
jgi:hypothetical protein